MSLITIFLGTYNRGHYLKKAIDSILAQSFKDYQIIILDNASTDDTPKIINQYSDNRIKYLRNAENIGALENGNRALELCEHINSEYISFFTDDDIMMPTLLESEIEVFRRNKDVILVAANNEYIDDNDNRIKKRIRKSGQDLILGQYQYIEYFFRNNCCLPTPGVMLKRSVILENNFRFRSDIGPAADSFLWFEMNLLDRKLYLINQPLVKYRIHPNQDSQINYFEMEFRLFMGIRKFLEINNLQYLTPYVKIFATREIMKSLSRRRCCNGLSKDSYISLYNKFMSNNLIGKQDRYLDKLHSIAALYFPWMVRPLYKAKKYLQRTI